MTNVIDKFRAKIGEAAYTPGQVSEMLAYIGLGLHTSTDRIREYAKRHELYANLKKLGIKPAGLSSTRYWIPKSNLVRIIEGLNIPVVIEDLERAAQELNFQT